MARGRGRSSSAVGSGQAQRDAAAIATDPLTLLRSVLRPIGFTDVEDLRRFHPDESPPALTVSGTRSSFRVGTPSNLPVRYGVTVHRRPWIAREFYTGAIRGVQVPVGIQFDTPFKVITCVRRKIRRNVMFAKRKVGLGAKKKVRNRNWRSNVRC